MVSTSRRPGVVLMAGLIAALAVALAPAGIRGEPIPALSWTMWAAGLVSAVAWFHVVGVPPASAARRVAWLLPLVALFALPAGLVAPAGRRSAVMLALLFRALSAASIGAAMAAHLGPSGLVMAARRLRAPARLCDILEAMLSSLTVVTRQVRAMLRAREARRPSAGAWADLRVGTC